MLWLLTNNVQQSDKAFIECTNITMIALVMYKDDCNFLYTNILFCSCLFFHSIYIVIVRVYIRLGGGGSTVLYIDNSAAACIPHNMYATHVPAIQFSRVLLLLQLEYCIVMLLLVQCS